MCTELHVKDSNFGLMETLEFGPFLASSVASLGE
jgi:hypothetical protein